ncbi:MAG: hypothetical protein AB9869_17930 [Verrucomicrobiia bacterium]
MITHDGRYMYKPTDPRVPYRQGEFHDMLAGKTPKEIATIITSLVGPDVPVDLRKANIRRMRRGTEATNRFAPGTW